MNLRGAILSAVSGLLLLSITADAGSGGTTLPERIVVPRGPRVLTPRIGGITRPAARASSSNMVKVSGDNQALVPINQVFPQPLVVALLDGQDRPVAGMPVVWTVKGSATLSAINTVTGADGQSQVIVTAGNVTGTISVSAAATGITPLTFSLESRFPGPVISPAGFVNSATNEPGLAPGNLVLIIGEDLVPDVKGKLSAVQLNTGFPRFFKGFSVRFQTTGSYSDYAPIQAVTNENGVESVLIQVPFALPGPTVDAFVKTDHGNATVTGIPVKPISPGILERASNARRAAIVLHSDGKPVLPDNPARPGESVTMYAIGLGATSPVAETNRFGVAQRVLASVAVLIDGQELKAESAILAQDLIGLYAVQFYIPADAQAGERRLELIAEASPGQPVHGNVSIIAIGP